MNEGLVYPFESIQQIVQLRSTNSRKYAFGIVDFRPTFGFTRSIALMFASFGSQRRHGSHYPFWLPTGFNQQQQQAGSRLVQDVCHIGVKPSVKCETCAKLAFLWLLAFGRVCMFHFCWSVSWSLTNTQKLLVPAVSQLTFHLGWE